MESDNKVTDLKRAIGFWGGTAIVVGCVSLMTSKMVAQDIMELAFGATGAIALSIAIIMSLVLQTVLY